MHKVAAGVSASFCKSNERPGPELTPRGNPYASLTLGSWGPGLEQRQHLGCFLITASQHSSRPQIHMVALPKGNTSRPIFICSFAPSFTQRSSSMSCVGGLGLKRRRLRQEVILVGGSRAIERKGDIVGLEEGGRFPATSEAGEGARHWG